jgi:hypothetical protein
MSYDTFRVNLDYDLKHYSTLTALVAASKIFEIEADMSVTGDYLVWQKVSDPRSDRNGNTKEGFRHTRIQFSCYGTRFTSRQIADAITARYDDFTGAIGATGTTKIKAAYVANDIDGGRDVDSFKCIVDIIFRFNI